MARALHAITTAQVKAYHGYTSNDKDSMIDVIRPLITHKIIKYCNHDFESKARVDEKPFIEKFRNEFYLRNWPVASITTLVEDGESLTEDTDFYFDKFTGKVEKIRDLDSVFTTREALGYWTTKRNAIVVNYVGGVDLTTANDIVEVYYEMVGIRSGIKKRTWVDNNEIEQVAIINSVPKELWTQLDRYKHRRLT